MQNVGYHANIGVDGGPIARLIMDAFEEKFDIDHANRAAMSYEQSVLAQANLLRGRGTGRVVLRHISRLSPRQMTILPWFTRQLEKDDRKRKLRKGDWEPINATAGRVRPGTIEKHREWVWNRGLRRTWDTEIHFTPANWKPDGGISAVLGLPPNYTGPGSEPDETLLHEVVHGLRHIAGFRRTTIVPFQPDYDTVEEFVAILVTNIYRSERGRSGLRADHHGFDDMAVKNGIHNEQQFLDYKFNKAHMKLLRRQQEQFFRDLQTVTATFNPTRLVE